MKTIATLLLLVFTLHGCSKKPSKDDSPGTMPAPKQNFSEPAPAPSKDAVTTVTPVQTPTQIVYKETSPLNRITLTFTDDTDVYNLNSGYPMFFTSGCSTCYASQVPQGAAYCSVGVPNTALKVGTPLTIDASSIKDVPLTNGFEQTTFTAAGTVAFRCVKPTLAAFVTSDMQTSFGSHVTIKNADLGTPNAAQCQAATTMLKSLYSAQIEQIVTIGAVGDTACSVFIRFNNAADYQKFVSDRKAKGLSTEYEVVDQVKVDIDHAAVTQQ